MYKTLMTCENPTIMKNNAIYACGKCELCRQKQANEWKIRVAHELITEKKATYFTLTYAPNNLPICKSPNFYKACDNDAGGELNPDDVTKFLKRLRKIYDKKGIKLRYVYCGEYGGKTRRPHYHFILYGVEYSKELKHNIKNAWGLGHVDVDKEKISIKCIQYILGYTRKKLNDPLDEKYYKASGRKKPYLRTSKGIGKNWALYNQDQWIEQGTVNIDGVHRPIPRYYIKTIYKLYGVTIKYKCYSTYLFDGGGQWTNINPNNYKVIPDLGNPIIRKIIKRRFFNVRDNISSFMDKYQEFNLNKKYFCEDEHKRTKYYLRENRKQFRTYLLHHRENIADYKNKFLSDAFTTIHIRGGTDPTKFVKPKIDYEVISKDTQENMRALATNKAMLRKLSPYGKRNGIPFEELDTLQTYV